MHKEVSSVKLLGCSRADVENVGTIAGVHYGQEIDDLVGTKIRDILAGTANHIDGHVGRREIVGTVGQVVLLHRAESIESTSRRQIQGLGSRCIDGAGKLQHQGYGCRNIGIIG